MLRTGSLLGLALIALAASSLPILGQGGPPFRSDDPDTPANKNWEINTVFEGDRNPSVGSYLAPDLDINYGLGNHIQLTYEVPLAIQEFRDAPAHVAVGLGNSLLGVKWRFYAHHPILEGGEKGPSNFGLSIYPQLLLNNPTSSVRRQIVESGPQVLMPAEVNARIGPIRISGEVGYWFSTKSDVPNSWIRGVIMGHELQSKTEVDLELFDQSDTGAMGDQPRLRETTFGLGCRIPIDGRHSFWFLGMAGRSLVAVTPANGQPSWIASLGLQILTAGRRRYSPD